MSLETLKKQIKSISANKCISSNDFLHLHEMQILINLYRIRLAYAWNLPTVNYLHILIKYCENIDYLLGPSYTHMCATQYLKPLGYTSNQIDVFVNMLYYYQTPD